MASIYFVGTFRPIVCGIADYTWFLGRDSPDGQWGVLSFDPASSWPPAQAARPGIADIISEKFA